MIYTRNFKFVLVFFFILLQGCSSATINTPTYARQYSSPLDQPESQKLLDPKFPVGALVGQWRVSGNLSGSWNGTLFISESQGKMEAILEIPLRNGLLQEYFDVGLRAPRMILQGIQYRLAGNDTQSYSMMTLVFSWNEKTKKFFLSDFYNQNGQHGGAFLSREAVACTDGNCVNIAQKGLQLTISKVSDQMLGDSKSTQPKPTHHSGEYKTGPVKKIDFPEKNQDKVIIRF